MELKPTDTLKRIPELDGLRGIAILMVVGFHYINNTLLNPVGFLPKLLSKITYFGWAGVDLFFVLSGFLIGSILIENKGTGHYFRTFYIRRLVRIVPNYYLLIIIFLIINLIPAFQDNQFLSQQGNPIPMWSYFAMVHNFYMGFLKKMGNGALSVTWSIGIEEQFYIIFPWIVFLLRKKWLPIFLILTIGAAIFFRSFYTHWVPPYVLLYCRMDAIAFGVLIAYFHGEGKLYPLMQKYSHWVLLFFFVVLGLMASLYAIYSDLGVWRNTLLSIIFCIGLLFALYRKGSIYAYLLRMPWLRWIGKISYSFYLFHFIILGIFSDLVGNKGGVAIYSSKGYVFAVAALVVSLVFSWLVYTYLEKPMVQLGKHFSYRKLQLQTT